MYDVSPATETMKSMLVQQSSANCYDGAILNYASSLMQWNGILSSQISRVFFQAVRPYRLGTEQHLKTLCNVRLLHRRLGHS